MLLLLGELARIEGAVGQGRVYDEPGSLSCTDAALRDLGLLEAGVPVRKPRSPRRGAALQAGQAPAVNWLDLPDLDRLIALRRAAWG